MTEYATGHNTDPHEQYAARLREDHQSIMELAQDGGALATIAAIKLANDPLLAEQFGADAHTSQQVFDIILQRPQPGEPLSPRWELVQKLHQDTKNGVEAHASEILKAAVATGMRREGDQEDYTGISPNHAVYVIEGGANKTSVVRRGVMENALRAVYGEDSAAHTVFQFGGRRQIEPLNKQGKENPEYKVIKGLAGELLGTGVFTEFEANVATARADGYSVVAQQAEPADGVDQTVTMAHPGGRRPTLIHVQPSESGLTGGFSAVKQLTPVDGRQFVIASNGQYRAKDTLQAVSWAHKNGIDMLPAVALGDESGDSWVFKGETFKTPQRQAAAYLNELAIYGRSIEDFLAGR